MCHLWASWKLILFPQQMIPKCFAGQRNRASRNSPAYAAKAAKAEEAAKAKAAAEAEAKANASAESDALEGEFELVDGEATPKQAQTIESLVSTIQGLVDASEHSMECVLSMLLASSETVKLVTK